MTKAEKKRRKRINAAKARENMKKWPYIAPYPKGDNNGKHC